MPNVGAPGTSVSTPVPPRLAFPARCSSQPLPTYLTLLWLSVLSFPLLLGFTSALKNTFHTCISTPPPSRDTGKKNQKICWEWPILLSPKHLWGLSSIVNQKLHSHLELRDRLPTGHACLTLPSRHISIAPRQAMWFQFSGRTHGWNKCQHHALSDSR